MREIPFDEGVAIALDSLLNDRLALLVGAGLSMASPSMLPSAAAIAAQAKAKYDATYGLTRAPLPTAIEDQAEFFFQRNELSTIYFRTFVDQNSFAGPPNQGHHAIADMLLFRGIQTAVTTNVDLLIETAGQLLFGEIAAAIDGFSVAAFAPDVGPLLKIHGCRKLDKEHMVWAPGQLEVEPVAGRIVSSAGWLSTRLLDRDLVIVGYWTDWDYLNQVLDRTLGAVRPARVVVVDVAEGDAFARKAPELLALGERAQSAFLHIKASGSDFLASLRLQFSKSFVRRVLHSGREDFRDCTGAYPNAGLTEPPDLDNETLWQIRRDLEGCFPSEPAQARTPPDAPVLGHTLLQLRAGGAVSDGPYWVLQGQRLRVISTPNRPLHRVEAAFARETAPAVAPDIVIAVGAEAYSLAPNIARVQTTSTIARGNAARWLTRSDALEELGL